VKVFVAGGSGLVGSSLIRNAPADYKIFAPTRQQLNLEDKNAVASAIQAEKPDAIILAAAKVGGISANSRYQRDFLAKNLEIQNAVIMSARNYGVPNLVFLGSSCIYPRDASQPISESSLLTGPLEPTNEGYAIAKIAGVRLCRAISEEDGLKYFSLMPTNLYGPNDNFHPENSHVPAALIRRFHEAKLAQKPLVKVWGSGRPKREFMHVDDLADACWKLLGKVNVGELLNVGTGHDVTIAEFAEIVARVIGYSGKIEFDTSKPDGAPRKLLSVERIHSYGWRHKIQLEQGLVSTYKWFVEALDRGQIREF
jgi:GDP-L-fucose synthase